METKKENIATIDLSDIESVAAEAPYERYIATVRTQSQVALRRIAICDSDPTVRHNAVGRLTNQAVLQRVARTDQEPYIRRTAVWRLRSREALQHIADTDTDTLVGQSARVVIQLISAAPLAAT